MDCHLKKSFSFFLTVLLISVNLFFSCNQNSPQISTSDFKIVFDYKDETSLPDVHLSLFTLSVTDPRFLEKMTLDFQGEASSDSKTLLKSGNSYQWKAESLIKIRSGDTYYAGYPYFASPDKVKFPEGPYSATYTAYNGEEVTSNLSLSYDKSLYGKKSGELKNFRDSAAYIVLYNENNEIIYYGEKTDSMSDMQGIWNSYNEAKKYREIFISEQNNQMIVFPEVKIVPVSQ